VNEIVCSASCGICYEKRANGLNWLEKCSLVAINFQVSKEVNKTKDTGDNFGLKFYFRGTLP
jgi:hypothetical protein